MEGNDKLEEFLGRMCADDRNVRLGALTFAKTILQQQQDQDDLATNLWREGHLRILNRMQRDPVERCREAAAECVLAAVGGDNGDAVAASAPHFFAAARARLAAEDEREPSEEVRVLLVAIAAAFAASSDLSDCADDDVVDVLRAGLRDAAPRAKVGAAAAAVSLAEKGRLSRTTAEQLLEAALKNLPHQQRRVRTASVKALGCCLLQCDSSSFRACMPGLAQRLFDPADEVRRETAVAAGKLATEWTYRHDNFAYLVPLLVTGLEDAESDSVRSEAESTWHRVGEQWAREEAKRDRRVKDLLDFPEDEPANYPREAFPVRPPLGCRMLVSRVFYRLKEAVARDLTDWLADTRAKAAQLLHVLVLHLEGDAVGHADFLFDLITRSLHDSDRRVVRQMCRSATLLGRFIPPKVWLSLLFQRLKEKVSTSDLLLLRHVLSGSDPVSIRPNLDDVALCLQQDTVCHVRDDDYQLQLLGCASSLLDLYSAAATGNGVVGDGAIDNDVVVGDVDTLADALFAVAVTADALAQSGDVASAAKDVLHRVQRALGHRDRRDLFVRRMGRLLKRHLDTCREWGAHSHHAQVFATLVREGGSACVPFRDQILSVFACVLNPQSSAPDEHLQIRMLLVAARAAAAAGAEQMGARALLGLVLPLLKYRSGKKRLAVRTAAAAALWAMVASCEAGSAMAQEVAAPTAKLMDDSNDKIRGYAIRTSQHLLQHHGRSIEKQKLDALIEALLKRLDDPEESLRVSAMAALARIPISKDNKSPEDPSDDTPNDTPNTPGGDSPSDESPDTLANDVAVHTVAARLLFHMDDGRKAVRAAALDALLTLDRESGGEMLPRLLEKEKAAMERHVHREEVDALVSRNEE